MKEEILREKDVLKNDDEMIGGANGDDDSEQEAQDGPTDSQEDGLDRNQHVKSSNLFEKVPASTINNSTEGDGANGPIEANDITEQRED